MRLDKFLKVSRLIKRRSIAQEACAKEKVVVNDVPRKASYDVKIDDEIELSFGAKSVKVKVLSVTETGRKDDAQSMYRFL